MNRSRALPSGRTRLRVALCVAVALAAGLAARPATADPTPVAGRWRERRGLVVRTGDVSLAPIGSGTWQGLASSPGAHVPHRLTLRRAGDAWTLQIERRVEASVGASGVLEGRRPEGWAWGASRTVHLAPICTDGGDRLRGGGFDLAAPCPGAVTADPAPPTSATAPPGALGLPALPVVRVLITGFDRFPLLQNHPHWQMLGVEASRRVPPTNSSGWAVRTFDEATLDPALRGRARIELHRLLDVGVNYVWAGQRIADEIARLDADVCVSFGVGSDGNVDADVETTCANRMADGGAIPFSRDDLGPYQLPASWPPSTPRERWSAEDKLWVWRYPDNGGVSYGGKAIDPAAASSLTSSLPVAEIVRRVEAAGLSAHDGMGGPGEYVCNNVMFRVVQAQAARGKRGGFVHLAQWDEARAARHLTVVRCAIEASVEAVLAARTPR